MTSQPDLEALYAAPSADIGPTSHRDELLAAARVLQRRDGWLAGELFTLLVDVAAMHGPDGEGYCCRDQDRWPCFDIQAAQKVAFAVGYRTPGGQAVGGDRG
jgi:hypothetical protein